MGRGVWQATVREVTKSRTRLSDFTTVHQIMMIVVEVVEVVVLVMVAATIPMRSNFLFSPWTNTNIRFSTSNVVHSMFGRFSNILIYRNMNPILSAYSSPFIPAVSQSVSSVPRSCPALCNPTNHSMPCLPVHHQLSESTQTHVHQVGDAIQPSHPLSSPSRPAPNPSQHQSLFHGNI